MPEKFERIVDFAPAFDKRSDDPNKNYGICAVRIWFVLKGNKGAVQFVCGTKWYLPETIMEYKTKRGINLQEGNLQEGLGGYSDIYAYDLGYHSKKPRYKGQLSTDDCIYAKPCYYGGSGLNAIPLAQILLKEGSDGIWKYLEKYYKNIFG